MSFTFTLKRAWLIIILALGLLVGLIGMFVSEAAAAPTQPASIQTMHQLTDAGPNYYCPPPPFSCF